MYVAPTIPARGMELTTYVAPTVPAGGTELTATNGSFLRTMHSLVLIIGLVGLAGNVAVLGLLHAQECHLSLHLQSGRSQLHLPQQPGCTFRDLLLPPLLFHLHLWCPRVTPGVSVLLYDRSEHAQCR